MYCKMMYNINDVVIMSCNSCLCHNYFFFIFIYTLYWDWCLGIDRVSNCDVLVQTSLVGTISMKQNIIFSQIGSISAKSNSNTVLSQPQKRMHCTIIQYNLIYCLLIIISSRFEDKTVNRGVWDKQDKA